MSDLPKRVLLAVTGAERELGKMGKVGLFFSECAHPFAAFKKAGYEVEFVSENGEYHIDSHSLEKPFLSDEDAKVYNDPSSELNQALKKIKKASDVKNVDNYGIFFAAGGHGALFDFYTANNLHKIASDIYKRGGVIAAVCHGPCILFGPKDDQGAPIVKGKNMTGFTENGEVAMGVMDAMNELGIQTIEKTAIKAGANYIPPPTDWEDFIQIDGRVVSGVNPASATSTAEAAMKVLEKPYAI